MVADIREAGGEVYSITSEPNSRAIEAEDAWNMTIPVVADPHHEIRRDLKDRGWIDVFYNSDTVIEEHAIGSVILKVTISLPWSP